MRKFRDLPITEHLQTTKTTVYQIKKNLDLSDSDKKNLDLSVLKHFADHKSNKADKKETFLGIKKTWKFPKMFFTCFFLSRLNLELFCKVLTLHLTCQFLGSSNPAANKDRMS